VKGKKIQTNEAKEGVKGTRGNLSNASPYIIQGYVRRESRKGKVGADPARGVGGPLGLSSSDTLWE